MFRFLFNTLLQTNAINAAKEHLKKTSEEVKKAQALQEQGHLVTIGETIFNEGYLVEELTHPERAYAGYDCFAARTAALQAIVNGRFLYDYDSLGRLNKFKNEAVNDIICAGAFAMMSTFPASVAWKGFTKKPSDQKVLQEAESDCRTHQINLMHQQIDLLSKGKINAIQGPTTKDSFNDAVKLCIPKQAEDIASFSLATPAFSLLAAGCLAATFAFMRHWKVQRTYQEAEKMRLKTLEGNKPIAQGELDRLAAQNPAAAPSS